MGGKSARAPDYRAAAEEQAASSREVTNMQTWANRPTINTPWGSQTWDSSATIDPATGQRVTQWTQNTELNPLLQESLDSELQVQRDRNELASDMTGRLRDDFGQPLSFEGFQELRGAPTDPGRVSAPGEYNLQSNLSTDGLTNLDPSSRYYDQAGDAIYDQWSRRAERNFGRDSDALRTQLLNQGLSEGDEAYDREMEKLRESQNDARTDASLRATMGAGQEASRMFGMDSAARGQMFGERQAQGQFGNDAQRDMFGMDLSRAGFNADQASQEFARGIQGAGFDNTLRQQQISEALQQRGYSLNEINAIMSGQQVAMPTMPGFSQAGRADATNYFGAAQAQYSAAQDAANARNSMIGDVAGMAGSFMLSDRRLKRNVRKVAEHRGINLYAYEYVWGQPSFGVMADEVSHIPGAVVRLPNGYDAVDYGVIFDGSR